MLEHMCLSCRTQYVNICDLFQAIFGNDEYVVRGGGGDFTSPGSTYQYLHADLGNSWMPGNVSSYLLIKII